MATYASADEYLRSLEPHGVLPKGFRVGTQSLDFKPIEVPDRTAKMTLTLIALDKPTDKFAAMFTSNTYPGAPVLVGRKRLNEKHIQAIVVNNKISNVCAPGGVQDSEAVCAAVAKELGLPSAEHVIPSSTGIIGWKLPTKDIVAAVPTAAKALQDGSAIPAAHGICTTDLYAKCRSATVASTKGRIVGIAKGAGMIEPNLATMLVYIMTDVSCGFCPAMLMHLRAGLIREPRTVDAHSAINDIHSVLVPAPRCPSSFVLLFHGLSLLLSVHHSRASAVAAADRRPSRRPALHAAQSSQHFVQCAVHRLGSIHVGHRRRRIFRRRRVPGVCVSCVPGCAN